MNMRLPRFVRVRQSLRSRRIDSIDAAMRSVLSGQQAMERISPGQSVAIAVGSRGIDRIDEVVRSLSDALKYHGAKPFVVPAMGSHGGANDAGQQEILETLGITSERMGCEVVSSMETVWFEGGPNGRPIHFDTAAARADHVIPINRIKPHTRLHGTIQSGLSKMLLVGLGNHLGALEWHRVFADASYRFDTLARDFIPAIQKRVSIPFGMAVVEDGLENIGHLECVPAEKILERDAALLEKAKAWSPRLPVRKIDLLIVDEIGKNISGTGLDTNVIGRKRNDKVSAEHEWPKIKEIYVRALTPQSNGNANGIGIAEYTHRRLVDAMDAQKTRVNCITAAHVTGGAVPIWFESDFEVLEAVMQQGSADPGQRRWVRIRNTLQLSEIECSEALLSEMQSDPDLTFLTPPTALSFNEQNNLAPL